MTSEKYEIRPAGEVAWATVRGWRNALNELRHVRQMAGQTTVFVLDKDGNDVREELLEREFETDYNKEWDHK